MFQPVSHLLHLFDTGMPSTTQNSHGNLINASGTTWLKWLHNLWMTHSDGVQQHTQFATSTTTQQQQPALITHTLRFSVEIQRRKTAHQDFFPL